MRCNNRSVNLVASLLQIRYTHYWLGWSTPQRNCKLENIVRLAYLWVCGSAHTCGSAGPQTNQHIRASWLKKKNKSWIS